MEFKGVLEGVFDLEKVVDDFLLLSIFMGNDFLPQLYCMNVKGGTFDLFVDKLKALYEKEKKYLTDRSDINWEMLAKYFESVKPLQKNCIASTLWDFDRFIEDMHKNELYHDLTQQSHNVEILKEEQTKEALKKIKKAKKEESYFKKLEQNEDDEEDPAEKNTEVPAKPTPQLGTQKEPMTVEEQKLAHRHDTNLVEVENDEYLLSFKNNHNNILAARENINLMKCIHGNNDYFKENYYRIYFSVSHKDSEKVEHIVSQYI